MYNSHVHSGAAWTLPPVQPLIESSPPGSSKTISFTAIQQLQIDQGFVPTHDKRSLLEIQEEEQARRAEDDFLKWWAAEEERVRMDAQVSSHPQVAQATCPRKAKGARQRAAAHNSPAGPATGLVVTRDPQPKVTGPGGKPRRHAAGKADRPKLDAVS
jgi:hypothetical protein